MRRLAAEQAPNGVASNLAVYGVRVDPRLGEAFRHAVEDGRVAVRQNGALPSL